LDNTSSGCEHHSVVLPAWATVVIALGASLIGALAGVMGAFLVYRAAKLNIAAEDAKAWSDHRLKAALGFLEAWSKALEVLPDEQTNKADLADWVDNERLTLLRRMDAVSLLFGADSPADKASIEAVRCVDGVYAATVGDVPYEELEAWSSGSSDARSDFVRFVFVALRPEEAAPAGGQTETPRN
jgi:hypothetical protein